MFHKSKLSTTYLLETTTDIPKDCRSSICSNNLTNPNSWVNYIQRFKINMFVLRRGFFIYGKRVYISSTQSIQTSVQLWYVYWQDYELSEWHLMSHFLTLWASKTLDLPRGELQYLQNLQPINHSFLPQLT